MEKSTLITLIVSLIGSGGLLGGIYALLKLRPEAGQITVNAAQGAVIVQTGVIENLRFEIKRLTDKLVTMEAENAEREKEAEESREEVARLKMSIEFWQRDVDRHGRMTELARRRSHVLANGFSSLGFKLDGLIKTMQEHEIEIPKLYDPSELRQKVMTELEEISELERDVTYGAVKKDAVEIKETPTVQRAG